MQVLVPFCVATALAAPAQAAPECATYGRELAIMAEAADAVRSRVDYLAPPEDRVAGELYVIEELPAAQVAQILGLANAKAVYNRVYRALAAMLRGGLLVEV